MEIIIFDISVQQFSIVKKKSHENLTLNITTNFKFKII